MNRLYEDASKKGAVIIHGLEEVTIHNASEVYKIIKKGSDRRQTAATLMNTQSRSLFFITKVYFYVLEMSVNMHVCLSIKIITKC